MALNPQVIGTNMPHGFAGCYARQPDMIVETRPAGGIVNIVFGTPLKYDENKNVVAFSGTGTTAAQFAGVAAAEIKSAMTYLDPSNGQFAPGEAVGVFQRGSINVKCYGTRAGRRGVCAAEHYGDRRFDQCARRFFYGHGRRYHFCQHRAADKLSVGRPC